MKGDESEKETRKDLSDRLGQMDRNYELSVADRKAIVVSCKKKKKKKN